MACCMSHFKLSSVLGDAKRGCQLRISLTVALHALRSKRGASVSKIAAWYLIKQLPCSGCLAKHVTPSS